MASPPARVRQQHVRLVPSARRVRLYFDVFAVMLEANQHVFQVLTKRPGRYPNLVAGSRPEQAWRVAGERVLWVTSVESQKYAPRLTVPRRIPAPVRFVSAEPNIAGEA